MRLILNNSNFVTRVSQEDSRMVDYLVSNGEKNYYVSSKDVKEYIRVGVLTNAYLNTSGVIVAKKYELCRVTNNNEREFKDLCKIIRDSKYREFAVYFGDLYTSKIEELQNFRLCYYGKEIVAFCYVENNWCNASKVYITWYKNTKIIYKLVNFLSTNIKGGVFCIEEYTIINKLLKSGKFSLLNNKSSLSWEYRDYVYDLATSGVKFITLKENANIVVDYIEKDFKSSIDVTKLEFKNIRNIKTSNFAEQIKKRYFQEEVLTWSEKYGHSTYLGFHYFGLDDIFNSDKDFLICLYHEQIVGVVKYGIWENGQCNGQEHQSISYIDVHLAYRNMGIATAMIKQLNNTVYDNIPLTITDESAIGKTCHMAAKMKKEITKVGVKTYQECMQSGSYI